ncbi:MFS transporter [Rhodoferax lacus]|nr:MFS transporter [Rhodoferax lacus]
MRDEPVFDWRTIGALNAVSTLAQVGQFGIAFVMLPVWLAQQGLDASQLGLFAASLWLGQLPGLALAPRLCQRLGERRVIVLGLLCTLCALAWISLLGWPYWLAGGFLSGFGLGLRWIGVEPWLYRIAPAQARGRLVGFHETLIALAPIIAPLLANFFGMHGQAVFWIGAAFTVAALLPLALARAPVVEPAPQAARGPWVNPLRQAREHVFKQGLVIASVGGMIEAAVSGLFALFTQGHGMTVNQTADLLAVFGLGGLLMQYAIGWLADHRGVGKAALVCALGTATVCIALALSMPYALVVAAVFLLGGFITSFLTLALIASTLATSGSMAGNVSTMSMVYTVSAVAGPLLAGASIKASHGDALMWLTAAAASVMALLLTWWLREPLPAGPVQPAGR